MRNKFDDDTIRYLEMIQGVINRLGTNSFSTKSWAVTLVAGVLALSTTPTHKIYAYVALMPVIMFWCLNSYYLQLERKYRALFEYVRTNQNIQIDFNLKLDKHASWIKNDSHLKYYRCFISKTELFFYLPIAVIVVLLIIIF